MIRTLATRTVYTNPWLTLREDEIERADGSRGIYSVVDKHDGALVVPWDGERVWLVGQYKYPLRRFCWELPQGAIDDRDASPEETARTELLEETGLRAGRLELLARLHYSPGLSSQAFHAWLATDLEHGEPEPEATEVGLRTRPVTGATFRRMVADGEITDAATIAAWSLLAMHGIEL